MYVVNLYCNLLHMNYTNGKQNVELLQKRWIFSRENRLHFTASYEKLITLQRLFIDNILELFFF